MKNGMKSILLACTIVFFAGFLKVVDVDAAGNQVMSIDPAGVEELMKSDNCPIIISIVTSRCRACRQELPVYQAMYDQYKDQGLGIFVVSIDFGYPQAIQQIVDRLDLTFPVYWGGDEVMNAFGISLVPYKFVVQNGEIVEQVVGAWSEQEIKDKVTGLLKSCP